MNNSTEQLKGIKSEIGCLGWILIFAGLAISVHLSDLETAIRENTNAILATRGGDQ